MERFLAWFRALSARERLLLQAAGLLAFGVSLPLFALQAAASYRSDAAVELAAARALQRDVAALARTAPAAPEPELGGSLSEKAVVAAERHGLVIARLEPNGPNGVRASFEPASALAVYRWIETLERSNAKLGRVVMVRAGEGDLVRAEATLTASAP